MEIAKAVSILHTDFDNQPALLRAYKAADTARPPPPLKRSTCAACKVVADSLSRDRDLRIFTAIRGSFLSVIRGPSACCDAGSLEQSGDGFIMREEFDGVLQYLVR